ncbi:MOSC domain-containing protein-containing protein [Salinisphaera shabanensis T35B1]
MVETSGPRLERILIAPSRGAAMQERNRVWAEPGRGLAGDRYYAGTGTFSGRYEVKPGVRELSLIHAQAIVECRRRLQADICAADLRRNLVIEGLPSSGLRGSCIHIGAVRLEILGSCPPCNYLSRLLNLDMRRGLAYIGGMRARIVAGGWLVQGEPVETEPSVSPVDQTM